MSINEFVSEHATIREAKTTGYKSNTECPFATPPCFPTTSVLQTLGIAIFFIHTRIVHMYIEYTHIFIFCIYSSECIISTPLHGYKPWLCFVGSSSHWRSVSDAHSTGLAKQHNDHEALKDDLRGLRGGKHGHPMNFESSPNISAPDTYMEYLPIFDVL